MLRSGVGRLLLGKRLPITRFGRPELTKLATGNARGVHLGRCGSQGFFKEQGFGAAQFRALSTSNEQKSADAEEDSYQFQAETSKLLDIVTNSIYTDKEVFLRELVSNAADALEKFRHLQTSGEDVKGGDRTLEIHIRTDKDKDYLEIQDNGIGMTKAEMLENLGTIARSGSKAFVEEAKKGGGGDVAKNMIGQFGVGFYSAFMVGQKVEVFSRSSKSDEPAHVWVSDGTNKFKIREAPEFTDYGTKIVIHLKPEHKDEYNASEYVKDIVLRYSNYVGFPVKVNDEQANKVTAIWTRNKNEITEEEYLDFYKFVSKHFEEPIARLHFQTDAPIDLKVLLFVPGMHYERFGMGRQKPGVHLYSRKVLLDPSSEKLLPSWCRFLKGVVDSEDLPLSLSRENMQDSRLLSTIQRVLTKKVIKFIADEAKKDPKKYNDVFYKEFNAFLKEGVVTDYDNGRDLAKLLRFSSSRLGEEEITSLDEYVSRMEPWQKQIYYLHAPTREVAENSAYFEMFKKKNVEVLFLHNAVDELVMQNLGKYLDRELVSAESGSVNLDDAPDATDENGENKDSSDSGPTKELTTEEFDAVSSWLKDEALKECVHKVTKATRVHLSPAIIVDHESASYRRISQMLQQDFSGKDEKLPLQHLQINTKHPIIIQLNELRKTNPTLASQVARQVFDNALVATGLVTDPRTMVTRLNKLLEGLMTQNAK